MKNYIMVRPRFSDFNLQGILKASTHLDLACESQLEQMSTRYQLPLQSFTKRGLRWHLADFRIHFPTTKSGLDPMRIEADVVGVEETAMLIEFAFYDEDRSRRFAFGHIRFELVDKASKPVKLDSKTKKSLEKYGRMK